MVENRWRAPITFVSVVVRMKKKDGKALEDYGALVRRDWEGMKRKLFFQLHK